MTGAWYVHFVYKNQSLVSTQGCTHRLAYPKSVHSFRHFLHTDSFVILLHICISLENCNQTLNAYTMVYAFRCNGVYALAANKRIVNMHEHCQLKYTEDLCYALISWGKYQNGCTPLGYVNLCSRVYSNYFSPNVFPLQ